MSAQKKPRTNKSSEAEETSEEVDSGLLLPGQWWRHYDISKIQWADPDDPYLLPLLEDVQANIFKGHGRDYSRYIFFNLPSDTQKARNWVSHFASTYVTTAKQQMKQTAAYKANTTQSTLVSIMFSAVGCAQLYWKTFPDDRFSGADRSGHWFMGLISDVKNLGAVPYDQWDPIFQQGRPHGMILVARGGQGEAKEHSVKVLDEFVATVRDSLFDCGGKIIGVESGIVLRNSDGQAIEHFGYRCNISQPQFFKPKPPECELNHFDSGAPFVQVLCSDPWGSFGSYMTFMKMEQDVDGFHKRLEEMSNALKITKEQSGALVVGRYPNGHPVTGDKSLNNFNFESTPASGFKCPFAAHIRRVNPRGDTLKSTPNIKNNLFLECEARIVRRSVSYGNPSDSSKGMLFMATGAGIDTQLYTLQTIWANNPNFLQENAGVDAIIGMKQTGFLPQDVPQQWVPPAPDGSHDGRFNFEGFVKNKGGEYFWIPSMSAMYNLKNPVGDGYVSIDTGIYVLGDITIEDRIEYALWRMNKPGPFKMLTPDEAKHILDELKPYINTLEELCEGLRDIAVKRISLAPISKYHSGNAALGNSGAIYLGSNIEFPGVTLVSSVHAETSLVQAMLDYGEVKLESIACTAKPCGYCLQFLQEFANEKMSIYVKQQQPTTLDCLLPEAFSFTGMPVGGILNKGNRKPVSFADPALRPTKLEQEALNAAKMSWSPYTSCPSGVAVLTKGGSIVTGSYIESQAYNPSFSPMLAAISLLVGMGIQDFSSAIKEVVLAERADGPVKQAASVELLLSSFGSKKGITFSVVAIVVGKEGKASPKQKLLARYPEIPAVLLKSAMDEEHPDAGVAIRQRYSQGPLSIHSNSWLGRADPKFQGLYADIQGGILLSHGRNFSKYIFFQYGDNIEKNRDWTFRFSKYVTSARNQFVDVRSFRIFNQHCLFINIMLSANGFAHLGWKSTPEDRISHFTQGMKYDAGQFGAEPISGWEALYRDERIDGMILVASGESVDALSIAIAKIKSGLAKVGGKVLGIEKGIVLRQKPKYPGQTQGGVMEHFGNRDNVSQPLFMGPKPDISEINRYDPGANPSLVLKTDPYGSFGSYVVYQKLEQDVDGYHRRLNEMAEELKISREKANALVVGRFPDGTPIALNEEPCTPFGATPNNNFAFGNKSIEFNPATAERPACPFAAHIRQVNPRADTARTLVLINNSEERFERKTRIVRRGVSYGHPDSKGPKGLLFFAMMAGIEAQFFVQQWVWANNPNFTHALNGIDSIIGQTNSNFSSPPIKQPWIPATNSHDGTFYFGGFVKNRGGEYFWMPSMSALKSLKFPVGNGLGYGTWDRTSY